MPKVTTSYQLPDENFEYRVAVKGFEYWRALREIKEEIRRHTKYDKPIKEAFQAIQEICKDTNTDIEG